jgi:hypothetical protein
MRTKSQQRGTAPRIPAAITLCLLGVVACSPNTEPLERAQDTPPDAAAILGRSIEAAGGKTAFESLSNCVMKGVLSLTSMGLEGTYTAYFATGGKMYTVVEFGMIGKSERGTDSQVAWEVDPMQGPRIILGLEKARLMRDADFLANLHWRDHYREVEYAGSETFAGQDCHKVVLTPNEGTPVSEYYAKDSGLLVGSESDFISPSVSGKEKTVFRDYREVGGVKVPHEIVSKIGVQEFVIRLNSVQYNVDVPPSRFEVPESVGKPRK